MIGLRRLGSQQRFGLLFYRLGPFRGNEKLNVEPLPTWLFTHICPPMKLHQRLAESQPQPESAQALPVTVNVVIGLDKHMKAC